MGRRPNRPTGEYRYFTDRAGRAIRVANNNSHQDFVHWSAGKFFRYSVSPTATGQRKEVTYEELMEFIRKGLPANVPFEQASYEDSAEVGNPGARFSYG